LTLINAFMTDLIGYRQSWTVFYFRIVILGAWRSDSAVLHPVRNLRTAFLLGGAIALTGCWSTIGPKSVVAERPDYNSVIEDTAMQQTFVNLIRARERKPTLFLDVSEVDVSLEFQGTATGSLGLPRSRAGAAGSDLATTTATTGTTNTNTVTNTATNSTPFFNGHDFTVGGSMLMQESPTIRYVPLQGQNLVEQTTTPITVDAISDLIDSGWPPVVLLSMVTTKLTPIDQDYYPALGAIAYLTDKNALEILAEPANRGGEQPSGGQGQDVKHAEGNVDQKDVNISVTVSGSGQAASPAAKADDSLVLYCIPNRIAQAAMPPVPAGAVKPGVKRDQLDPTDKNIEVVWNRLRAIYGLEAVDFTKPNLLSPDDFRIVIRSQYPQSKSGAGRPWYATFPALRTRSALGVLRDVTHPEEDWDLAVFVDADLYEKGGVVDGKKVDPLRPMVKYFSSQIRQGQPRNFYVFDSSPYTGQDPEDIANQDYRKSDAPDETNVWKFNERIQCNEPKDDIVREALPDPVPQQYSVHDKGVQEFDEDLGYPDRSDFKRHFMIVLCQPARETPFKDAYVSAVVGNTRYSIDAADYVTQNNFALVNQLVTIQAVAQNQTLTPTIGVGAH
jgi:hypothetical protein